jgi:hypothetical protein
MDACGHDGAGPDRRDGAGRVCGSRTWAEGGGQPACGYARHAAARSCRCHRAAQGWARGPTEERERRVGRWVSAAARVRRPAAGGPQASRRAGLIARGANRSVACLVGYSYTTFRRLLRRRRIAHTIPGASDQQAPGPGKAPEADGHSAWSWRATGSATWPRGRSHGSSSTAPSPLGTKLAVSYHTWPMLAALLLWLPA